jgi:hypothetical protein
VNETAQQYTQRILSHSAGQDALKLQAATPKKLERLIKGVGPAKLRKKPAPGKWSVAEIIAHLADSEIVIGWRMRSILGAPGSEVQAYDQNAWNANLHYDKRDVRKDVIQLRVNRDANLALLKTLTGEQWKQFGVHSERGQESIEHIVKLIAGHDLNHIQQIEGILAPKKKESREAA